MKCFKCGGNTRNQLSKYGYYEYCPRCGNIFETTSQSQYNMEHFLSRQNKNKSDINKSDTSK